MTATKSCWVVTDGKAGMESQCVGLAEALGFDPIIKRVGMRAPWRQLSPYLRLGHRFAFRPGSDPLEPPWPDLLIGSGRRSIAAVLHVRAESRKAGRPTITVQIQDPVIASRHFDLVIAPAHDRPKGRNVLTTFGALHRITPAKLVAEAARLAPRVADLPRPLIGALIGGANAAYRFGPGEARQLGAALRQAAQSVHGSLLVTPSRRTGEKNLAQLKAALGDVPAFVWDGKGENPYFGMLGLADQIVVTSDSVNMVSEAVATGKPVHVFDLPGGSTKFARFHDAMRSKGLTHPFAGALEAHRPATADDDMRRAVTAVQGLLVRG